MHHHPNATRPAVKRKPEQLSSHFLFAALFLPAIGTKQLVHRIYRRSLESREIDVVDRGPFLFQLGGKPRGVQPCAARLPEEDPTGLGGGRKDVVGAGSADVVVGLQRGRDMQPGRGAPQEGAQHQCFFHGQAGGGAVEGNACMGRVAQKTGVAVSIRRGVHVPRLHNTRDLDRVDALDELLSS